MNCKLCGYYYSTHEKGTVCQHCGGNREKLEKTRLMTISKIIAGIALIMQIFTAIFTETISGYMKDIFDFIRNGDGIFLLFLIEAMFFLCIPFVYVFTVPMFFGTKKNNFVFYFLSAIVLIPSALITPSIDFVYAFFFTVPCVLFLLAGITAMIDKQNQKVKNKK